MFQMPSNIKFLLIALCSLLVIAAGLIVIAFLPLKGSSDKETVIYIRNGDSLNVIASKLKQQDLVVSRSYFKWLSVILGKSSTYKRGEYLIDSRVSVMDLVNMLTSGQTSLVTVTIPEGLTMRETFEVLKAHNFDNGGDYPSLVKDPQFIASLKLPLKLDSLEGFLFPETYKFSKDSSAQTIIRTMVKTFKLRIPENYSQLAGKVGLSYYEALILASIIEKETSIPAERRIIASVFHNRLKNNMKLQTDPTVIYGIPDFDGNLTRRQLRTYTPYNTYVISGLPPTPIANPGLASLLAAVRPAKTDYLFFVAKGDGTHEFTESYKQHRKAVYQYQKRRNEQYRSY